MPLEQLGNGSGLRRQPAEHLLRDGAGQLARGDAPEEFLEARRGHARRPVRHAPVALVQHAKQLRHHPVARDLRMTLGHAGLVVVAQLAALGEHDGVVRGQRVALAEARLARPRQLGVRRARRHPAALAHAQDGQIGIGKVAIVVRVLLRAHDRQPVMIGVVKERRLGHALAGGEHRRLPRDLGGDAPLHALD